MKLLAAAERREKQSVCCVCVRSIHCKKSLEQGWGDAGTGVYRAEVGDKCTHALNEAGTGAGRWQSWLGITRTGSGAICVGSFRSTCCAVRACLACNLCVIPTDSDLYPCDVALAPTPSLSRHQGCGVVSTDALSSAPPPDRQHVLEHDCRRPHQNRASDRDISAPRRDHTCG